MKLKPEIAKVIGLFNLLILADFVTAAAQHNHERLIEYILNWGDSNSRGTIAYFDQFFWTQEHELIDQLVERYHQPLTILQPNYEEEEDEYDPGNDETELVRNNIILFSRSSANLKDLYKEMKERYPYLGHVLAITEGPSELADQFISKINRHDVQVLFFQPWRPLESRTCCWGYDRHIRRKDLHSFVPTIPPWEKFSRTVPVYKEINQRSAFM